MSMNQISYISGSLAEYNDTEGSNRLSLTALHDGRSSVGVVTRFVPAGDNITDYYRKNRWVYQSGSTTTLSMAIAKVRLGENQMADKGVLTDFITAALKGLRIEKLEDATYFLEIPSCPGVWANDEDIVPALVEIREALESWLLLKIWDRNELPVFGDLNLNELVKENEASEP